jgi:hypothetical protein
MMMCRVLSCVRARRWKAESKFHCLLDLVLLLINVSDSGFKLLNDGTHGWGCLAVAVPSPMACEHPGKKALEGWRIAVKDVFNVKGLRTSNGSRAFLRLYPPADISAPSVQKLVDLSVSILGKTKLSAFLSRE